MSPNRVQKYRQSRQWSQTPLGERVGVSRASISAIEGGLLSPSVITALTLSAAFECSVEELFGQGGSEPSRTPA